MSISRRDVMALPTALACIKVVSERERQHFSKEEICKIFRVSSEDLKFYECRFINHRDMEAEYFDKVLKPWIERWKKST